MFQAPCPAAGSSCLGFHSYYRQYESFRLNQHFAAVPPAFYGCCPVQAKTQELKEQLQMSLKLGVILLVRGRQQNEKLEEAIRMSVSKKRSTKERIASDIEDILWVHSA